MSGDCQKTMQDHGNELEKNTKETHGLNDSPPEYFSRSGTPSLAVEEESEEENIQLVPQQNQGVWTQQASPPTSAFHLEFLIDVGQMVMHKDNLRLNQAFNTKAVQRMEIIDETRRVLLHVEQDEPEDIQEAFLFHLYNRNGKEVITVLNPQSEVCICRGATWHWLRRCRFQAVVFSPPGVVVGFVRRAHTFFVQEYHILNPQEQIVLILRGGPLDLEIYSADMENELGRLSVHGWVGIMHEVRRTGADLGLTFPLDLDVHVKAVLVGAMCAIDWLISCEAGKKIPHLAPQTEVFEPAPVETQPVQTPTSMDQTAFTLNPGGAETTSVTAQSSVNVLTLTDSVPSLAVAYHGHGGHHGNDSANASLGDERSTLSLPMHHSRGVDSDTSSADCHLHGTTPHKLTGSMYAMSSRIIEIEMDDTMVTSLTDNTNDSQEVRSENMFVIGGGGDGGNSPATTAHQESHLNSAGTIAATKGEKSEIREELNDRSVTLNESKDHGDHTSSSRLLQKQSSESLS